MTIGTQPGLLTAFTMATNLAGNTISFRGPTIEGSGLQFVGSFAITGGPCDGSNGQVAPKNNVGSTSRT